MIGIILCMVFILLYKLFDELQDESVNSFWNEDWLFFKRDWLNKKTSWMNKWHNTIVDPHRPWYYLWLIEVPYIEAFPYSSTFLVWLTDGEHFFQLVKDICIGLAVGMATGNWITGLLAWLMTYLLGFIKEVRKG